MNVFMGYNPLVAKQVKVSVWVKEIDGAEPILPATPKDGDCFIVFDTDDDVLADNPSSKKAYANGSWGDAGGGGSGVVIPEVTLTGETSAGGTYTSTVPYQEMVDLISDSPWGDDEVGKAYPFLLKRVLGATVSPGAFFTAVYFEGTISIYTATSTVTLNEDGTYTEN